MESKEAIYTDQKIYEELPLKDLTLTLDKVQA